MQAYRQPSPIPLITLIGGHVIALDPDNGALRWEKKVGNVARIAVTAHSVFLAITHDVNTTLLVFDAASGHDRGTIELDFRVTATLQTIDRLYFAGWGGLVALTHEGATLFRLTAEVAEKSGWAKLIANSEHMHKYDVVGKNAGGHEMFRIHGAEGGSDSPSLLALGANVAQVDNA